jgi:hypothetical protein
MTTDLTTDLTTDPAVLLAAFEAEKANWNTLAYDWLTTPNDDPRVEAMHDELRALQIVVQRAWHAYAAAIEAAA